MCYLDMYALFSHQLFNRTGLYAESHGIVANVSDKRAVLNRRIDPMCRISGMQRLAQSFITTTTRLAGKLIGGKENRCGSRHT